MIDRRRFERYPIYSPISYSCENERQGQGAVAVNVSDAGALITSRRRVEKSRAIDVRFIFRNDEFVIRSRVVHAEYERYEEEYRVGVEFMETPYSFIKKMHEEIDVIKLFQSQYSKESGTEMTFQEAAIRWYLDLKAWA